MSRRYWVDEENEDRKLRYIECDSCNNKIEPNPEISESGWVKRGVYHGVGSDENSQWDLCPNCAF